MPLPGIPLAIAGVSGLLGFLDRRKRNEAMEREQRYVDDTRRIAGGQADMILNNPGSFFEGPSGRSIEEQAGRFHNPYQSQVIAGIQEQFGRMRDRTKLNHNAGATAAGAFGGSRHALQTGAALGELGAAEGQQIGGLLHSDWNTSVDRGLQYSEYERALRERQAQEPVWRANQALGLRRGGMGPTGLPQGGSALAAGLGAGIGTYGGLTRMFPGGGGGAAGDSMSRMQPRGFRPDLMMSGGGF